MVPQLVKIIETKTIPVKITEERVNVIREQTTTLVKIGHGITKIQQASDFDGPITDGYFLKWDGDKQKFTPDIPQVGAVPWGEIQGNIEDQEDLAAALSAKSQPFQMSFNNQETIVVNHNLGRKPGGVSVIDSTNRVIGAYFEHNSINQLTVYLGSPYSGSILIN